MSFGVGLDAGPAALLMPPVQRLPEDDRTVRRGRSGVTRTFLSGMLVMGLASVSAAEGRTQEVEAVGSAVECHTPRRQKQARTALGNLEEGRYVEKSRRR